MLILFHNFLSTNFFSLEKILVQLDWNSSFFLPSLLSFIENRFLSHTIHPNYSFPSLHSPKLSSQSPLPRSTPPPFSLQKRESLQETTAKEDNTTWLFFCISFLPLCIGCRTTALDLVSMSNLKPSVAKDSYD